MYELENPRDDGSWITRILGHNPCENNLIRKVKNHQLSKGEKGPWKGEKGRQGGIT